MLPTSHGPFVANFFSMFFKKIEIPYYGLAHRDPENSGGDRVPAPIGTPKQLSGGSRLAKEPHFDQTVFDNGLLCQSEVDFQAELDVASIWERVRVFTVRLAFSYQNSVFSS